MVKRDGYKVSVFNNVSELITEKIGVIDGDYYEGYINNVLPNKNSLYTIVPTSWWKPYLREMLIILFHLDLDFMNI